jgi:phage shock protein C
MEKKLYRNEHDKMIAGVASGLADYLQVEVTIVRLLFVLSAIFLAGGGLIAYIVMWIILPVHFDPAAKFKQFFGNNPNVDNFGNPIPNSNVNWSQPLSDQNQKAPFERPFDYNAIAKKNDNTRIIGGLALLIIGSFLLLREFDILPDFFKLRNLWPVILIVIGINFIAKANRKTEWEKWKQQNPDTEPNNTAENTSAAVKEQNLADNINDTNTNNNQN